MKRIMEVARQRGEAAAERLQTTYRALLEVTTTVVARARRVQEVVTAQSTVASRRIAQTLAQFLPQISRSHADHAPGPAGGAGASEQSFVSLFEPDTAIIRKGKPGKPTEFGRVLWLDEVEGGIISRYAVLDGNPDEKAQVPRSLTPHRQQFGQPPTLLTGDRGLHSRPTSGMRRPKASRRSSCPSPARSRPSGSRTNAKRGFARGATGGPALKGRVMA